MKSTIILPAAPTSTMSWQLTTLKIFFSFFSPVFCLYGLQPIYRWPGQVSLKPYYAHKSLRELINRNILILSFWGGAYESAFLISSQMMLMLFCILPISINNGLVLLVVIVRLFMTLFKEALEGLCPQLLTVLLWIWGSKSWSLNLGSIGDFRSTQKISLSVFFHIYYFYLHINFRDIISVYQWRNWGFEKLNNPSKVTQLYISQPRKHLVCSISFQSFPTRVTASATTSHTSHSSQFSQKLPWTFLAIKTIITTAAY